MAGELRDWIPVRTAADRLRVSPEQVRELVRSGDLDAIKPGRDVLVRSEAVERRATVVKPKAGRPLSPSMAWAVLWLASDVKPPWLSSSELVRARRHVRRPLSEWPRLLAGRAQVHRARMPDATRKRVRSLTGVAVGGPWAARLHGANLVLPDGEPDEWYLAPAAFDTLRTMKGIGWQSASPNVVIRVVPDSLPAALVSQIFHHVTVSRGTAAADLLDLGDDRSRRAAAELLGRND
ncbi:helix-turn-helix domain-containing protein [Saccharothrix texasensis]|uniref:Excisionase family DNA binding protein n=1 Tax=Saccharothrix texasensis TaxID=103734 RepID=A0A3N1H5P9_9PSEU|nr:helix-turn-helix domain-containing protein [Saccharothrix texasensis]ROP37847.1 excisionase family DNA binding protein [Saccharothrix texasensis]